jgi:hypothetical protein
MSDRNFPLWQINHRLFSYYRAEGILSSRRSQPAISTKALRNNNNGKRPGNLRTPRKP